MTNEERRQNKIDAIWAAAYGSAINDIFVQAFNVSYYFRKMTIDNVDDIFEHVDVSVAEQIADAAVKKYIDSHPYAF